MGSADAAESALQRQRQRYENEGGFDLEDISRIPAAPERPKDDDELMGFDSDIEGTNQEPSSAAEPGILQDPNASPFAPASMRLIGEIMSAGPSAPL